MTRWRPLLICSFFLGGCADLLGVQPLSGVDASAPDSSTSSLPPQDAGALDGEDSPPVDAGCTIAWVGANGGAVPAGAMPNPVTGSTVEIYVCRVSTATLGVVPGKLLPGYACYYGDGAKSEVMAANYEVLVAPQCTLVWEPSPTGVTPVDAIVTGQSQDGGLLYSCQVGTTGTDPGELGHEGWSTDHACIYSLGGSSLTTATFNVLTAH